MEPCFKTGKNTEPFNSVPNNDDITSGYGRGLLSWYNIDPRFWGVGGKAPSGITLSRYLTTLQEEFSFGDL
jgi:hypothetical protein